jgi:phosphatidate cytidylyltransferase
MVLRILSAAILIPLVLAGVYYARPWPFLAALGVIGTLCLYEYFSLIESMSIRIRKPLGYALFWALLLGLEGKWIPAPMLLSGLSMALFLSAMWQSDPMRDRTFSLMASLLGLVYPCLFLFAAQLVRFEFGSQAGLEWFLIVLAVTWAGDSAALFVGKRLGRTAFAEKISPKKTNEGAVGGLLGGILAAMLLQRFLLPDLAAVHVFAVAVITGTLGQFGDLAESMLKRGAGVKDSSKLIPGHGGVLDRIDSLLFAFPAAYFYLWFFQKP